MSNTFGALYINGQQINLPGGGIQGIGQFAIPASGAQNSSTYNLTSFFTPIPLAGLSVVPIGALIIPPASNTLPVKFKMLSGDTGAFINPEYPSWIAFDPANPPADIYLAATGGTVAVTVQFI